MALTPPSLSSFAWDVRRYDPDRFRSTLFAPVEVRDDLFAVLAFNSEIARIPEMVREPTLGAIRLQWWRDLLGEVYQGERKTSWPPLAQALAEAIARHQLPQNLFLELLDERERDLEPMPIADSQALATYVQCTGGHLNRLVFRICSTEKRPPEPVTPAEQAAAKIGSAYAVCGLLRATPYHLQQGRLFWPQDALQEAGDSAMESLRQGRVSPESQAILQELIGAIEEALAESRRQHPRFLRSTAAAFVPVTVVTTFLSRLKSVDCNLFHQKLFEEKGSIFSMLLCVLKAQY